MKPNNKSSPQAADQRLEQAREWLKAQGAELQSDFIDVAGDASFRRYFRVRANGVSRVLMDAPPANEDVRPFIDIAGRLESAGLHPPEIILASRREGFLLLEDLGDELYRGILNADNADELFPALFNILKAFALEVNPSGLPAFSAEKLRQDMDLFPDWYLRKHRPAMPAKAFDAIWEEVCGVIISSALAQPQCFVHRDFHSCNLLRVSDDDIGIIDFQDGVTGPISYDLVSLLWDRYIRWPRTRIETWVEQFRKELELDIDTASWLRFCDLMGLQRNLKIIGIFARLNYRDGKRAYLDLIPRFYEYVTDTLGRYPEFSALLNFMEDDRCAP